MSTELAPIERAKQALKCVVADCERPVAIKSFGLCRAHYHRLWSGSTSTAPIHTKSACPYAPLTKEWVRFHLEYNASTGIFRRRVANSNNSVAGDVAGARAGAGYIEIKIDGKSYKAHRLAWLYVYGHLPRGDIDHANMDREDNRLKNLRAATRSQNQFNRPRLRSNKSGFKGVSWHKATSKFVAQASLNGKKCYLGVFGTPEEAAAAYRNFARRHHGEFARN